MVLVCRMYDRVAPAASHREDMGAEFLDLIHFCVQILKLDSTDHDSQRMFINIVDYPSQSVACFPSSSSQLPNNSA